MGGGLDDFGNVCACVLGASGSTPSASNRVTHAVQEPSSPTAHMALYQVTPTTERPTFKPWYRSAMSVTELVYEKTDWLCAILSLALISQFL